jgi:uncharacterized membrane protein YdjX (TVP38/TMEM64 family)
MSRWIRLGSIAALVVLVIAAAVSLPVSQWADGLVGWLRDAGALGVVAFAAAYVGATVLMLPGLLLTVGAGVAYGTMLGTLVVSPASVIAATAAFLLGRTVARGWIAQRIDGDPRFRVVDAAIARHGLRIVILLRLSPLFPFNLLNYALGLTGVRLRDYVLGSFIGMLPATFLYVYIGSLIGDLAALSTGADQAGGARQALSVVGLLATVVVTVYVTRIARRALSGELESAGPVVASEDAST